jgi:hypothetical protein
MFALPVKTAGRTMQRIVIASVLFLLSIPQIQAQKPVSSNPCSAPEQKQFDFWVGEWDLTWPGDNGEAAHGTNNIKRVLDGCIVQENFSGANPMPLRGTSVSVFDVNSRRWKQTWVDNSGGYLDFVGEFKDGQMILQRQFIRKDGSRIMQRMVWKNISHNDLDWSWEASKDGGKTWQVNWPIHYKRRN